MASETCFFTREPSSRPSLNFWQPDGPLFSWVDFLHISTLTDEFLNQLLLECHYAQVTLQKEFNRRCVQEPMVTSHKQKPEKTGHALYKAFNRNSSSALLNQPEWLIVRLTGSFSPVCNEERLSVFEKASLVSLAINQASYPGPDPAHLKLTALNTVNSTSTAVFPRSSQKDRLALLTFFAANDVPDCLFSTASFRWSEDGEIEFKEVSLPKFVKLLKEKHILHPVSKAAVNRHQNEIWKAEVIEHVCQIFPKDGHIAPTNYTQMGYALLPILRHVADYLYSNSMWTNWDDAKLSTAFEAFLSATHFGDLSWKLQAIRVSEELALLSNDHVSRARVEIRHLALRRLFPHALTEQQTLRGASMENAPTHQQTYRGPRHNLPRRFATNKRSNAFLGQLELFEVQTLIDDKASSEKVLRAIQRFQPFDKDNLSLQENLVLLELRFLYAKSLRYWGKIEEAHIQFQPLLDPAPRRNSIIQDTGKDGWHSIALQQPATRRLTLKIAIQYAELQSERRRHSIALGMLEGDRQMVGSQQRLELGAGRRLTLALANARLIQVVDSMQRGGGYDNVALAKAAESFRWLESTYAGLGQVGLLMKQSAFQASCGLAMVHHLAEDLSCAFELWEKAKSAARQCWETPGFA
ncbi:hypothetical protein CDEST_14391 [Colletotrichum destructivum]|uniref:Uncharacterized protein n=1 Tax=Colletotrichum destructivum TaxID=34406 RepID=A0AAX4J1F0_9PEZI|nr:hypothetical protein CDEST_14391 [Colletotrichum destructivum]